jgi:hypothetical protein
MAGRFSAISTGLGLVLFLGLAGSSYGQDSEGHPFTLSVGGGFTTISGRDAGRLDHGGNVEVGGGYFFNRFLGVTGNFTFNQLGITGGELARLNEPDGNGRVYTVTVDPEFRLPLSHGWSAYLLAGGGYMRRTIEFTQPTVAATVVFDPWWGYFGPALVPVNQVLGSVTSNAGMFDVGGGVNVPLPKTRLHIYIESRYLHGFTQTSNTILVPIMVGIRW